MPSPHAHDDPFLLLKAQGVPKIEKQNPEHVHSHPPDSSFPASSEQFTPPHFL